MPAFNFYSLRSSRANRTACLLEEPNLDYELEHSEGLLNGLALPEFAKNIGTPLGKLATIEDGNFVLSEGGVIIE